MRTFTPGQRVRRVACNLKCDSADCDGITVGSVGSVKSLIDANRTSVMWDHRSPDAPWWVWNHALEPVYQGKHYIDLLGGDRDGGA
jgi:hypothetical protein